MRIGVGWRSIAEQRPVRPTDPADPAYRFRKLDRAVSEARARGLIPVLTVQSAPTWAEGPGRPSWAHVGAWKPSPAALGDFATALTRRYGGNFADPTNLAARLPQVRYFEVWNEANLSTYLSPQWEDGEHFGPQHFRRMVNAFHVAAHRVQPDVTVLAGGLSPIGDGSPSFIDGEPIDPSPWGPRSHPMSFIRTMLCLKGKRLRPRKPCPDKGRFDVLSVHPISQTSGPREEAPHPDDMAIGDLPEVKRALRAAERHDRVIGDARHGIWVTEYWWQTRPPREQDAFPTPAEQARWIAEAQMEFWLLDIPVGIMYSIRDEPFNPAKQTFQAGVYFANGVAKPSLPAARFPVAAKRRSRKRVYVWTRPPQSGPVALQRLAGDEWRTLETVPGKAGVPIAAKLRMKGSGSLRAVVDGRPSYVYELRR